MKSQKGSQFEREVAKELSLWWSEGKRDDLFWRTAGSGARATIRMKKGLRTVGSYGDIASTSSKGSALIRKVVFSLKKGYSRGNISRRIDILDIVDKAKKRKSLIVKFWEEVYHLADRLNKHPILIFRRDRSKGCIAFELDVFRRFLHLKSVCGFPILFVGTGKEGVSFVVMTTEEFYKHFNPKDFFKVL